MYADMQKCHKAAHKNIKTGSGILTVDEAKILLKSHPEYILPQDSRMIHLLQNHKLWEFRDAEQTLELIPPLQMPDQPNVMNGSKTT